MRRPSAMACSAPGSSCCRSGRCTFTSCARGRSAHRRMGCRCCCGCCCRGEDWAGPEFPLRHEPEDLFLPPVLAWPVCADGSFEERVRQSPDDSHLFGVDIFWEEVVFYSVGTHTFPLGDDDNGEGGVSGQKRKKRTGWCRS